MKRKCVGHGTIDFVRRAIVRLFCEFMRAFSIFVKVEAKSREIGCDRRLVGRTLMKTLENVVKLGRFVIVAR